VTKENAACHTKTALLFKCYYLNKSALKEFEKIRSSIDPSKFDIFYSYDNTRNDLAAPSGVGIHIFSQESIATKYTSERVKNISLWKNTELSTIDFCLTHPEYSYYWVIDHDVRFTGNWNDFLVSFLGNDADLIATYVSKYGARLWHVDVEENWWAWSDTNLDLDNREKTRAFFAIYRFSNQALEFLDDQYLSGAQGFCEMIVPTLLDRGGFKIDDIGSAWYNKKTFNYFGRRIAAGSDISKLYHPVLPLSRLLQRRYKALLKSALEPLYKSRLMKYLNYYNHRIFDWYRKQQ
jgi:hypothetical protein